MDTVRDYDKAVIVWVWDELNRLLMNYVLLKNST